ncbi:hypothetical protein [Metabacillus malikii]|uniref:Type IV pilus assembly protein PilO n=1 Tax=Metabacillus malikii TaxID=1504265 RepID=A0ABT9ZM04_9BACI|nr:hypothetical protein [Metabacillus malikii]MDQ0232821.1 type IV pilus assembly protein PilO [Metabacillus malikii]
MRIELHRKHVIILIASVILLGLLYLGGYFLYLQPIKDEIQYKKKSNTSLQEKLDKPLAEKESRVNSYSLLQRVPVDTLIDQFVLDLEKAVIVSNSTIRSVDFSVGEVVLPETEEEEANIEDESGNEDELDPNLEEGEAATEKVIEIPGAPEGLEQLSINISVTSENFLDLKKFVEVIESQTRITMVNQLSFSEPAEVTEITDIVKPINYELHLTAFYLPTLSDLIEEDPSIIPPQPSEKTNPFIIRISK